MFFLRSIFAVLLLTVAASAGSQAIKSGEYGSLLIGVAADGTLTGHFRETTGMDENGRPRFTCSFVIRGESGDDGFYRIKTWHPEFREDVIEGELSFVEMDGRSGLRLKLGGEHGGCWNVAPMLKEDEGVEFELTTPGDWTEIRMAKAAKAYFHSSADAKTKGRAFVVKNDVVRISEIRAGWAEATFKNDSGRTTRGWLKTDDLYPAAP
ncbi:MAG: hypothetical protein IPM21_09625 [Acidobacteria bacterium]|nr:hypothetical protein [Acidobacteriota bacterium]